MAKKHEIEEHHVIVRIYRNCDPEISLESLKRLEKITLSHAMRYDGKPVTPSKRFFLLGSVDPVKPDEFLLSGDPDGSWDVSVVFRDAYPQRRRRM